MPQTTTDLGLKKAIYRLYVDQYRSMGHNRKDARRLARAAARIPAAAIEKNASNQSGGSFRRGWDQMGWQRGRLVGSAK